MPIFFAISAIFVCILLKPKIVRSTAEFEFNGCFNCQPFGGTPFEVENPRRNTLHRHQRMDDEVQRPIQLNPLPLPTGRPTNPQMLMDLNVKMTTNKRHLDDISNFGHVVKAEFSAYNNEPNMGRKRARDDLGGKMEQQQPIIPIEMQQMLKKQHRTLPENADTMQKRIKSIYDAGIPNMEQQDDTPITQEELVQLHRAEPMLETPELQLAVHVVEMQAKLQIRMTARHSRPMANSAAETAPKHVKIAVPVHPAQPKRAHTAQEQIQAVHARKQVQFLNPVQPAQPRHAQSLQPNHVQAVSQRQQQMRVLDPVQLAETRRAHTAQEQVQPVLPHELRAQTGAERLQPAQKNAWEKFRLSMKQKYSPKNYQHETLNINGTENGGRKTTAGTERSLENTYGTKRAMLMNADRTAEENLENTVENIEDPNVFQFKTIYPTLRPRGSVVMRETTPSVESVSMQDAWSEDLDFLSTASTGGSPMDIDAKISSPKTAANVQPKSVYEMMSESFKRTTMSGNMNNANVEMARRVHAILEMSTKGPLDFDKFFYLNNIKSTREKLRAIEYWWSGTARLKMVMFMELYGRHLAKSDFEKLTLVMECWQATLDGPCRCVQNVKLKQFKTLSKIADMFFSTDEKMLGEGGTARVYRGNSEYLGSCIAIKEVSLKDRRRSLVHQYRKEMAILNILAYENFKHSIRMYKSHEKNYVLTMALELGVMDLRKLWITHKRQFDKDSKQREKKLEKGYEPWNTETVINKNWEHKRWLTRLMEHLFKEMMQAVAEFHQIGMHLDLKLDNFLAVPDDKHGTVIPMPNGRPIKVRSKLIDFGGANLINPDQYRADLPEDVRKKMVTDTTTCIRHKVAFGTPNYMAPEQVDCRNGDYLVSTKSDIWAMGAVLYEMFKGEAPYAVLCQRKHPKWYHWDRANVEQKLDRIREYKDCMYGMAKDPRAVEQIEYPTHDQMFNDGSHQLWYIVKASLQFNARLRPTARGILAYLHHECRLQINKMGDLVAYHKDVPWKRCELNPKEGEVITSDPNRFNPYIRTNEKKAVGKV